MKTRALLTGLLIFVLLVMALAFPLMAQVNVTNFDNVRSDGFMRASWRCCAIPAHRPR